MRILLLTAQMDVGGAETHVLCLARALSKRGHKVAVASCGGRLVTVLRESGIEHMELPLSSRSPRDMLSAHIGLRRLIKGRELDVVHAHGRLVAFLADGICKEQGIPLVTTIHAHYKSNYFLDRLSRWGSGTVAVSYDLYRHLLEIGKEIPIEHLRIIPNGIDTRRFSPSENNNDALTVGFLSRLDSDCSAAAFSLCRILEELARNYDGIRMIIGGGGSALEKVVSLAAEVNSNIGREAIKVVGNVDDTVSFYRSADVVVGVSRVALEAMSCGVPVVLAGDEGFLGVLDAKTLKAAETTNFCCRGAENINDADMLNALKQLLDLSREERRDVGRVLRKYVLDRHSVDNMAEQTESLYKSVRSSECPASERVLLCGYYGFGNMGDDLLLMSSLKKAKEKYRNIAVCALTNGGRRESDRFGVRCASRRNIFTVTREIKKADVVVFGGGTLIQNNTSRRSLWYYIFILKYAQKAGKRVELWGNGIGNIKGFISRRAAAGAIAGCHFVSLRDKASFMRMKELLGEHSFALPPVIIERDLAFGLLSKNSDTHELLRRELGIEDSKRIAIIIPRGAERGDSTEALEMWAEHLRASGIKLVFVPMYPKQDMRLCEAMSKKLSGKLAYPVTQGEAFSLIRSADVVCSMRYHGLVLAADAGVSFIGFGEEEKIKSFCRENGGAFYSDILKK